MSQDQPQKGPGGGVKINTLHAATGVRTLCAAAPRYLSVWWDMYVDNCDADESQEVQAEANGCICVLAFNKNM